MEKANKLYKEYSQKTQEDMQNILDCLGKDFSTIPDSWKMGLRLIADNYEIYNQARDNIMKEGLFKEGSYGQNKKNENLPIFISVEQNILKLLKAFGLS